MHTCCHGNYLNIHPSRKGSLRMSFSALLSLIIIILFAAPTDAQSNRSCSVCNCQLKNSENLIRFVDNRVQTLVQSILNAVLATQPSKHQLVSAYTTIS